MDDYIRAALKQTVSVLTDAANDTSLYAELKTAAAACIDALATGHKVLFAGNGGSAADAQHLAAELVSRFAYDRPGLASFSLATDTSVLTAIGNDYGYDRVFARQIEAVGVAGDVFIGLTTSGRSRNVLLAFEAARRKGLTTIALTGHHGLADSQYCQINIRAPSTDTPKIQETHIVLGHVLCGLIERRQFPRE